MALVLYHVEDAAKEKQLSALCRELHLTARRLTNADRDRAVAALCGEKVNANVQKAPAGYKLPEVLIFSGFAGGLHGAAAPDAHALPPGNGCLRLHSSRSGAARPGTLSLQRRL